MNTQTYTPGVCNIGEAEINARRRSGWIGLIATIVIYALFSYLNLNSWFNLILFLPATISATGFIQAYSHFCAAFGMQGLFNLDKEVGKTDTVQQQEFRNKDRAKAWQIIGWSVLIGLIVALLAVYVKVSITIP